MFRRLHFLHLFKRTVLARFFKFYYQYCCSELNFNGCCEGRVDGLGVGDHLRLMCLGKTDDGIQHIATMPTFNEPFALSGITSEPGVGKDKVRHIYRNQPS